MSFAPQSMQYVWDSEALLKLPHWPQSRYRSWVTRDGFGTLLGLVIQIRRLVVRMNCELQQSDCSWGEPEMSSTTFVPENLRQICLLFSQPTLAWHRAETSVANTETPVAPGNPCVKACAMLNFSMPAVDSCARSGYTTRSRPHLSATASPLMSHEHKSLPRLTQDHA